MLVQGGQLEQFIYNRMNSSNELQIVGQEGVLAKKIQTQKEFSFKGLQWHYENNFHLSLTSEEFSSKLKIKNHLCEMTGNTIKKVTQIIHKNKKYTIQDNYSLHLPLNTSSQPASRETKDATSTNDSDNKNEVKDKEDDKKIYIFKKLKRNKFLKEKNPEHLRNTKNITKNFCKAFLSFLKSDRTDGIQRARIREGISAYNNLLEHRKYNNKLIKKIIHRESLRDLFRMFLEREARSWISQSRITDKTLHEEAISIYLNLFESLQFAQKGYSSESSLSEDRGDSDKESE